MVIVLVCNSLYLVVPGQVIGCVVSLFHCLLFCRCLVCLSCRVCPYGWGSRLVLGVLATPSVRVRVPTSMFELIMVIVGLAVLSCFAIVKVGALELSLGLLVAFALISGSER